MNEQVVLCRDCKHSFRSWFEILTLYAPLRCRKRFIQEHVEIDPVYGAKKQRAHYRSCSSERMFLGPSEVCGKEGKLWEPRDKKDFLVYLKRV